MFPLRALVLATLVLLARCDLELKLLHVLFRHGDKVPHREYQNYPTDPHRNHSYYPIDNGGLTNQGMMREYKIGRILRERYDQYFGAVYQPSMIYARSTEIPRTRMSLQLVLAGLFPPAELQNWNPRLPWIPTSTFSVPLKQDNLLYSHYCPRYVEEYKRRMKESDVQKIISKHRSTMDYLTEHTGKPIETTSAVYYLYNLLKEEAAQNLTLPEWTRSVYPSPMKEITELDFHLRSYTKALRRMNGGMLLRKIIDDMMDLRDEASKPDERKAFLFSAHEVNVVALARTLGTDDPILPPYGSTIILETLRDKIDRYYVRVILWTGVTERLTIQQIPGCTEVCPLEKFIEITKEVTADDAEYKCVADEGTNERRGRTFYRGQSSTSSSSAGSSRRTHGYRQLSFAVALVHAVGLYLHAIRSGL